MEKFYSGSEHSMCEYCNKYSQERLFVKLPDKIPKPRNRPKLKGKTHAFLCFDCVKEHCRSTLSNFWKMLLFPHSKEAKEYKKRYK